MYIVDVTVGKFDMLRARENSCQLDRALEKSYLPLPKEKGSRVG